MPVKAEKRLEIPSVKAVQAMQAVQAVMEMTTQRNAPPGQAQANAKTSKATLCVRQRRIITSS